MTDTPTPRECAHNFAGNCMYYRNSHSPLCDDLTAELDTVVAAEREACAKVAEELGLHFSIDTADAAEIATAIRARENTP